MASGTGNVRYLGIDFEICELINIPSDTYIDMEYMCEEGIFLRQKIELAVAVLFFALLVMISRSINKEVATAKLENKEQLVLLDAGHGGSDPGKVGVNGVQEKDINLVIAKMVKERLEGQEIEAVLIREEDEMLSGEGEGSKKLEDMQARVAAINTSRPNLTVSIHQNSYEDASVSGAQVFYYKDSQEGEKAAKIMQDSLLVVDESNTRQAKGNDSYYLLKRTEVPTIIVECGFLSNPDEAEKLADEEYQMQLADAICQGILEYLNIE